MPLGHVIALEQFALPLPHVDSYPSVTVADAAPDLRVKEDERFMHIFGDRFEAHFDKLTGDLASYQWAGVELFKRAPQPNFWRAYTDNDRGNGHPKRCATWRDAGVMRELRTCSVSHSNNRASVVSTFLLPTTSPSVCTVTYTVTGDGQVDVMMELVPGDGLPEIPEIGMLFEMNATFEHVHWFGKGPYESYWDRQTGAIVGSYSGKVADQFVPYLRPQECGNKTEVRKVSIVNGDGVGISIWASVPFELNVLPYTPAELEAAAHVYELPKSDKTVVRVNYKQMGVGGDDSWGARTHPQFTLPANRPYSFRFTLCGSDHLPLL
ncbi:MAG: hypothetical protein K6T83_03530 [Alicyclobacillus sp.]|nr:hypothetical protein [Alicyclobacillus sp.]